MTRDQLIAEAVAILCEAYRQKMTETTLSAYKAGLADLTDAEIGEAVGRAIRENKFMPTVAELRSLAGRNLDLERQCREYRRDFDLALEQTEKRLAGAPQLMEPKPVKKLPPPDPDEFSKMKLAEEELREFTKRKQESKP